MAPKHRHQMCSHSTFSTAPWDMHKWTENREFFSLTTKYKCEAIHKLKDRRISHLLVSLGNMTMMVIKDWSLISRMVTIWKTTAGQAAVIQSAFYDWSKNLSLPHQLQLNLFFLTCWGTEEPKPRGSMLPNFLLKGSQQHIAWNPQKNKN